MTHVRKMYFCFIYKMYFYFSDESMAVVVAVVTRCVLCFSYGTLFLFVLVIWCISNLVIMQYFLSYEMYFLLS